MIEIYVTDKTGYRTKITDLYWFEEQGVHDWSGDAHHDKYTLEVFIDGKLVWKTEKGNYETDSYEFCC